MRIKNTSRYSNVAPGHARRSVEPQLGPGAIKVGVEAFVLAGDQLLLGHRRGGAGEGEWGLPGGHLEPGETPAAGLCRELREELGIAVEPPDLRLVAIVDDPANVGGHYLHVGFVVTRFTGTIAVTEPAKCGEWRFFPLDRLPPNLFAGHRLEITRFRRGVIHDYA
jgi:ADP-ribose pyrophosphatase YjhB (NUDIX family)